MSDRCESQHISIYQSTMRACALVLACLAFAGQGDRVHLSSERLQDISPILQNSEDADSGIGTASSFSSADVRHLPGQRQLSLKANRVSNALNSLAKLLVTSNDPAAAYQIVGGAHNSAIRRPGVHQRFFHQRAPLSALVGQVKAPSKQGSILVLSNPMYLRPKASVSAGPAVQERPTTGAPLRGPPLRGQPLRGPPLRGPPLRGQPPAAAKAGEKKKGKKKGKDEDDGGYYDDEEEDRAQVEWKKGKKKKGNQYAKKDAVDDDDPDIDYRKKPKKRKQTFGSDGPIEVLVEESITVGELADGLRIGSGEIIKALMKMGTLANVNVRIDSEKAEKIAEMFGGTVIRETGLDVEQTALGTVDEDSEDSLVARSPVVTIMGHVDHGKTSLLDALRSANVNVTDGEAGGITQHIGAYKVARPDGQGTVTFIDTPGHAAFNEMRSRGANITDIVVLAVAADDGIMPQTVQSIKAAQAADVPIVVAFTKSDKPQADAEKVRMQLLEQSVVLEQFGGDVLSAEVSAKTGSGLENLFEQLQLQAETMDLKANPDRLVQGAVLEARQERGAGAVADVLVQRGTMKIGDIVVAGANWGRVRAISNEHGDALETAGPSDAVELIGLDGVPDAGDPVTGVDDEAGARELADQRQKLKQQEAAKASFKLRSANEQSLFFEGSELPLKVLDFVIKADVQGSAEALASTLEELTDKDDKLQVKTRILRATAGEVTSEDIKLCAVSMGSQIISFNKAVPGGIITEAADVGIPVKEFKIIYDVVDEVNAQIASLLRPPPSKQLGVICGKLDVKQVFKVAALGKVAGCEVLEGFIRVGNNIRILRGNLITYEGKLKTLRSFKDEVERVDEGNDCGMSFDDYQGMEAGDRVEAYMTPDQANEPDDDFD